MSYKVAVHKFSRSFVKGTLEKMRESYESLEDAQNVARSLAKTLTPECTVYVIFMNQRTVSAFASDGSRLS